MRDLRCPRHPRTKFAEVEGLLALVEVSCRPCRRDLRSIGGADGQVLHTFTVDGRCVSTEVFIDDVCVDTPAWLDHATR